MTTLSDYGDDDEVYDPVAYIRDMIDDLRRDAEGLKVDGNYSQLGLRQLHAADALEDLLSRNEELLEKLITIEDVVARALKN